MYRICDANVALGLSFYDNNLPTSYPNFCHDDCEYCVMRSFKVEAKSLVYALRARSLPHVQPKPGVPNCRSL